MPDFDRDPIQRLRDLADAGRERAHGLPAQEVRARGARRHRRRMVAGVAAASVAVAVFAGGALAATGQLVNSATPPQPASPETPRLIPSPPPASTEAPSQRPEPPTPSPSPPPSSPVAEAVDETAPPGGWRTEIPAGLRLDRALPAGDADVTVTGPGEDVEVPAYEVCDTVSYPLGAEPVDRSAVLAQGPEYRETRALTLYADAEAAQQALREFVGAVEACRRESVGNGGWQQRSIVESGVGESGYVVVQNYGQRGLGLVLGTYSSHLVRVGNALLFVEELGEGAPGSDAEVEFWAAVRRTAAGISADLCVFSAEPCAQQPPGDPTPADPTPVPTPGPQPDPGPAPEPEPGPTLPRSVLLRADQTTYHERGDFRVTGTVHGEGEGHVSVCQRDTMASLGAVDVWRRDFAFRRGGGPALRSAALQFPDERTAAAAYDRLGDWANRCRAAVRSAGYDRFSDRGRWYDVASGAGEARFRSGMTYGPVEGDRFGEMAYFDDQGLVLAGDRVMVVTLVVAGQDYNWSYSERSERQTGLTMHPMFDMLSRAAANLTE